MTKQPSTRERGRAGEDRAVAFLRSRGLEIVARNVTSFGAELDIIARERETIVFVEVRGRADDRRGHPLETIDARKQGRLRRAATGWLIERELWEKVAVRFDAIALVGERLEWVQDCF